MKAIGRNILIQPEKQGTEKTKGGLLLAKQQRVDIRYHKGLVLSVGDVVCGIKENDEIFYDKSANHKIDINGENYCIVKDTDVVIVI